MARTLFSVSAILLLIQPLIQAQLLPTQPCKGATPLKGGDGRDLFCGRGPNRVTCPLGSYCDIHPTDRWAKCCPQTAPVIKPGKCPVRRLVICKSYRHSCSSDASCKGPQKCCWIGCGRRCTNPVPRCGPICRIYCRYGFVHKNGCPICKCRENPCNFVDCLPDHQCIVVKQRAKCVPIKPVGPCPKPTGPGVCAELCGIRNKCTGGKICCSNGCGHQCMNPVRG